MLAPIYLRYKRPVFKFSWDALLILIAISMLNVLISFTFVSLSFHTVMSHTYMLSSLSGCIQLLMVILVCRTTHYFEKIGLLLALIGVVVMIADP